jgi:hypothetical protein
LKVSSAISATAKTAPQHIDQSSAKHPPTPSAEEFSLSGPSDLPDPKLNAYRKDLADVALANRVIASHYAEPTRRQIVSASALRVSPDGKSETIRKLSVGEPFQLLDDSLGWSWGYAGEDRRVGYVESAAIGAA